MTCCNELLVVVVVVVVIGGGNPFFDSPYPKILNQLIPFIKTSLLRGGNTNGHLIEKAGHFLGTPGIFGSLFWDTRF